LSRVPWLIHASSHSILITQAVGQASCNASISRQLPEAKICVVVLGSAVSLTSPSKLNVNKKFYDILKKQIFNFTHTHKQNVVIFFSYYHRYHERKCVHQIDNWVDELLNDLYCLFLLK
jgi:hypothetical protein